MINLKHFIFIFLVAIVFAFQGCNETNELGKELLPTTDILNVKNSLLKDKISTFTHKDGPIRTDEGERSLLGSFNDSIFGNTTADFAAQFRISSFPKFLGTNRVVDSISLYVYYRAIYGDTVTKQRLKVYELKDQLIADTTSSKGGSNDYPYYQDVNLKSMAFTKLLGQREFIPKVAIDSVYKDTVYQALKIPLDLSLGTKLLNANASEMVNNDVFLQFFKGLYIESEKISGKGGSIISLDAPSSNNYQAVLVLFYSNDSIKAIADTTKKSIAVPYEITSNSARVNRITHDYSGTTFYSKLNTVLNPDSLIYIQTTGGLKSKIFIPELTGWKDSVNIAINKAELVFQIDTVASVVKKYQPPTQLLFLYLDETNQQLLPVDYSFSPSFYGGFLNKTNWTYTFNITQHMQKIASKDENVRKPNLGFELTTFNKNSEASRVVLKGSKSKTGVKLVITYTKFLQ